MSKSHAAVWPSEAPTPDQLKEFFAQIPSGRVNKNNLQALLRGDVQVPASFVTDLSRYGLEVISGKEGPQHPTGVTVAELELREFLYRDEQSIRGEELVKRSRQLEGFFGLHTAEYLLQNQQEIPKGWRGKFLVFPATELRDSRGSRYVPYLRWRAERWDLFFYWLDGGFRSNVRLVRPRA